MSQEVSTEGWWGIRKADGTGPVGFSHWSREDAEAAAEYNSQRWGPYEVVQIRDGKWVNPDTPERPDWDTYFLGVAKAVAARSSCERDKVGAVLVDQEHRIRSTGYNDSPAGTPGCELCPRRISGCTPGSSYDNCVSVHAEANALLYADRKDCVGATLYITRDPCYACSKLIAGAGISRIITPNTKEI
ncbi:dCMP deaminase [Rhodococcus phage PhailMary]|uniref:Deoxycytidylate deaminase n=1 Tax=Rhodococcus phage PhailMary TaxID=2793705 RepID=A0A7T0Q5R4_9CAUD|nr:dCMP deaminase [Rhodococcus phage PhailMary]QPL15189.1 deoxycytidylate deaminase [Rhodococcus phage PhailMary]